jgi:DNA-binding transcriptional regulator YiaG
MLTPPDRDRGRRIAKFRNQITVPETQRPLSQQGLAYRAGVSIKAVQNWESGRVVPSGPNLARLAEALGHDRGRARWDGG